MTALPDELTTAAAQTLRILAARSLMAVTAESCTGGLVAAALTAIAGSSAVVDRGFVTYSNQAKSEMLGVPMPLIAQYGAVSEQVARAMASGALAHSRAHVAVAITGIAGPTGGSIEKPVGLVHFAAAKRDGLVLAEHHILDGNREMIRHHAVLTALTLLVRVLD